MTTQKHSSELPSRSANLSRRRFLRGVGACMALPAFESIMSSKALAADAATRLAVTETGAPLRLAWVYWPNGAIPKWWWPEETAGGGYTLNRIMKPLEKFKDK